MKRRLFAVEDVLPGYRKPKSRNWILTRNALFFGVLIFVSLFYGLLSAIFPVAFYIYMALPIIVIAAVVVWALPDTGRFPGRWVEALFWGFLYAQLIWPNYIALVLPGLPWITINRLVTAPLAAVFLIALSQSRETRQHLKDVFLHSRFIVGCFVTLAVLQVATLPLSPTLESSVNKFIDAQIQWNLIFIVAAYVFSQEGRAKKFFTLYPILIFVLFSVAVFEWRESRVLWADSIPSFLRANDESTQRMLSGASRASTHIYRVQSIFSTSLNFAEVLGLTVPFLLYWIFYARRVVVRIFCLLSLPPLFWMILCTDSRLGVIAFFVSIIVFTGIYGVRRWVNIKGDIAGPAIVMFYPFFTALFFVATLVSGRLGAIVWGNGAQQASNEGRELQWAMAWPKIGAWPFGHGTGTAAETLGMTNPAGILTIDSYYLNMLLEYGVIGFFAWAGMWLGGAAQATRWSLRDNSEEGRMLPIVAAWIIAFFIGKGVLSQDDSHGLAYMTLGMVVGMSWRAAQRAKQFEAPTLPAA